MQTAIAAIFVFMSVIMIHELGHFAVAKYVGIKVNEFSIGMGPKILQKHKNGTDYSFRLLPIGGYVSMEGEDEASDNPNSFNSATVLQRMAVIAAGAIMNFILAIFIFTIVSYIMGTATNVVDSFTENSPAENAGIVLGDKIEFINGTGIKTWEELIETVSEANADEDIEVIVKRGRERKTYKFKPEQEDGRTIIGMIPKREKSIKLAVVGGFRTTGLILNAMMDFLKTLFRGKMSVDDVSGPVGVISGIGEAAKMGYINLLMVAGLISVNLGFFNLLPIPALDGSRLFFLLIEFFRGKPISQEKEGVIHFVGFILLFAFMIFITYKDILAIFIKA